MNPKEIVRTSSLVDYALSLGARIVQPPCSCVPQPKKGTIMQTSDDDFLDLFEQTFATSNLPPILNIDINPATDFPACPECGKQDGYANAGRLHIGYCLAHRTRWDIGSNLFSSWRDQTEEEQRRIYDELELAYFTEL